MVMIKHPLSGTEYRRNEDGSVHVVKLSTGVSGTFDRAGTWLGGERRTADPNLCMWVSDGLSADGQGRATENRPGLSAGALPSSLLAAEPSDQWSHS